MSFRTSTRRALATGFGASAIALTLVVAVPPAGASERNRNVYERTNLISDQAGVAQLRDPNLVNSWGLATGPTTPLWVADNGTDVATTYRGAVNGSPVTATPTVVHITGGAPTGQLNNATNDFVVSSGSKSGPARFIFVSENGGITGWNPTVDMTHTIVGFTDPNAVYKGVAFAPTEDGSRLYAANFKAGTVDVFDGHFKPVHQTGAFVDPSLPAGFAPFRIAFLDGHVFVTYALQNAQKHDDVAGPGHGFIDVYTTEGHLDRRLVRGGVLNSPWGVDLAPKGFGHFGGALLVGNFGDGLIHAFDPRTGELLGTLRDEHHRPIVIDGLWGMHFGNGVFGTPNALVFAAGPAHEAHGLVGTLTAEG
jgi:uncharacterized protein (TIGR03118 family)